MKNTYGCSNPELQCQFRTINFTIGCSKSVHLFFLQDNSDFELKKILLCFLTQVHSIAGATEVRKAGKK